MTHEQNATYTVADVADQLEATGFTEVDQPTVQVVHDFAWFHPDWIRNGLLTVAGSRHIRFDKMQDLVFTIAGRDAVLDQLRRDGQVAA